MKASIVDLRYRMKDVLKALNREEPVTITQHGKVRGVIEPVRARKAANVEDHPFFGMRSAEKRSVKAQMDELREIRELAV